MEPTFERGPGEPLRFGVADMAAEQVRVVAEVLDRDKRDGVHPALYRGVTRRECRDPPGEGGHESVQVLRRECPVDSAVSFGEVGVVVVGAEQNLEGTGPAHHPDKVFHPTTAWK
ncbi:hypothetical protein GCM10022236_53280 [Microlunatus ginsengisoli]|uniref:Uncharacterized protein n=1 Tax=Microlunatus ginsengisoli TaxID=363863 RepID=A0ABP7AZ53_9ACTN